MVMASGRPSDGEVWCASAPRRSFAMRRSFRWITIHTLTLAAGAIAAPAASAQQPPAGDLLDQTRRMQSIAAQQVEAEVRLGLADATRLASGDRAKAVEKYKQLL